MSELGANLQPSGSAVRSEETQPIEEIEIRDT
jgi:hypothetical protein